ncbi:MAG: hypothetical protein ABSF56_03260 [Minisyncoccia bacterium]|jgi:hypothetical protein
MTPEERSMLERACQLSEENNKILRGIRRSNRFTSILHVLYWIVIIVVSFGAYYYVQPYLMTLSALLDKVGGLPGIQHSLGM